MADTNKKLHDKQLRDKYSEHGFSSLTERERLELLLTYSGCKNTEQLSEKLLSTYGCINALADADPQLLMKETGINQQTAVLLKLIPTISRALYMERFTIRTIKNADSAKKYFSSYFIGSSNEQLIVTAVSKRFHIEKTTSAAFGSLAQATASYRNIAELVIKSTCTTFFIAHNHPLGDCTPSDSDLLFTKTVITELSRLGAVLADHIIVGNNGAMSLRESGLVPEFSLMPLKGYDT